MLVEGDVLVLAPGVMHYTTLDKSVRDQRNLVFAFYYYDNRLPTNHNIFGDFSASFSEKVTVIRRGTYDEEELLRNLHTVLQAKEPLGESRAFLHLVSAFEALFSERERRMLGKTARRATEQAIMRKVNHIISDCYMQDLRLEVLAGQFFISTRQFGRLVREYMGDTFHALLTKRRLDIATALLCGSDYPVVSIAKMVGYTSPGGFYAIFKQHYGMLPGEYRKRYSEKKPT